MRLAIPLVLVLAATTSRDGCGNGTPAPHDPCAGKACGESCRHCAPDDRNCVETTELKACDPAGRCVSHVEGLCDALRAPCAGKACGQECVVDPPCRNADPPCMMPSALGHCDMQGICYVGTPPPGFCLPPPPSWGCVGKRCGDSCGACPEGTDPARCPVPTFAPTACDARLQCVTEGTFACAPAYDPCAGKSCRDPCTLCPPDATDCHETAVVKACDANGLCVADGPTLVCPP
jgi:hypothetical protein